MSIVTDHPRDATTAVDAATIRETLAAFPYDDAGSLADLGDRQPILLVFVRHFG